MTHYDAAATQREYEIFNEFFRSNQFTAKNIFLNDWIGEGGRFVSYKSPDMLRYRIKQNFNIFISFNPKTVIYAYCFTDRQGHRMEVLKHPRTIKT